MAVSSPSRLLHSVPNEIDSRYKESIDFLFGKINYERNPGLAKGPHSFRLERMASLLAKLGNPQTCVPCVHIAGTKGKGSTATMIARIMEAASYRVGLFTSPHAHRFEERMTVNGEFPTETEVVELVNQLRLAVQTMETEESGSPTFFELVTAAGWLHFRNRNVDLAVVEVGLGGRLDSTNVCSPLTTVITSISLDHTQLLGGTVELIAREKAGIIKPKISVISGVTEAGPAGVIEDVAAATGASVRLLDRDFHAAVGCSDNASSTPFSSQAITYCDHKFELRDALLAMPGDHQGRNAALAIGAVLDLKQQGFDVSEKAMRNGLLNARMPLRIEVVGEHPLVIIDAAHNPASIEALGQTLRQIQTGRRLCIFGSSQDKDVPRLMQLLAPEFDAFILTAYQENPRAVQIAELEQLAARELSKPWNSARNPAAALRLALDGSTDQDLVCATGSFFLAAEVKLAWQKGHVQTSH